MIKWVKNTLKKAQYLEIKDILLYNIIGKKSLKGLKDKIMMILIGPSASGKTEIAHILIDKFNMERMITYTTRPMRDGEVNHVSYHFVSKDEFLEMKKNNEFIETALYNNHYYGTKKSDVTDSKIVILEPSGLKAFKNVMGDRVKSFYLITSENIRKKRMIKRNDKEEDIIKRLLNDRIVFNNIEGVDYYIENEDGVLEKLAKKIYDIYKGE